MDKSTHKAIVFEIKKEVHPNADTLSIVRHGEFTLCCRTNDWNDGDLAVHVLPESIVPTTNPVFAFLKKEESDTTARVKACKMRGIWSYGCPVPAPAGSKVGDDVAELMGIVHYEPPLENASTGGVFAPTPDIIAPKYDVDSGYAYAHLFDPKEEVIAGEKLDGTNSRYVFLSSDNQVHCGSHERWIERGPNIWWRALEQNPWLEVWLKAHPDVVVYGEVYGWVQKLRYGHTARHYSFRAFDLMRAGKFMDYDKARELWGLADDTWAPIVYRGPWESVAKMEELAAGQSLIPSANHIREGVVVRPVVERWSDELGRVQVKFKSAAYLSRDY